MSTPLLSVIVVVFNMAREARRTLHSLSPSYQIGVSEDEYEVIVVDNGSTPPFRASESAAGNVRSFYIENASPSPVSALNFGVRQSRGAYVGTIIDGARLLTPGVIRYALRAFRAFPEPIVAVPAWHLGPDIQRFAMRNGYSREVEDALLERIGWPANPYRLFEISTLAASCTEGWFRPMDESSCLIVSRAAFDAIGGYDEQFQSLGGGLASHDIYRRLCALGDHDLVVLLGEGSFHQIHGGIATNAADEDFARRYAIWTAEYQAIRGTPYARLPRATHFLGHIPPEAHRFLVFSAERLANSAPLTRE